MAQVLAKVEYKRVLPALTVNELNEAYARLDERYNCLRSNWEWFVGAAYSPYDKAQSRVEQN
ncbi:MULTISPECIES: hypothetical protein [Neomoorella]|jgi:hypothetical protein|uniref:hypothetical protein n=1 Tax=Neomoorella TaxID=44260 RepID=UPI0010FFC104|nr:MULTISPECIES: hypothetical protein [unclassified Moorella (in: firmicutes)]MDK2816432.1 hypothetical protein [Moorella sp. (in: firmicutes)]MDK2895432.1 hypothetical protein [Moorella sp. (in: firmicutes)]GEA16141.1 hypothetical protein E308F_23850 [Moorella sp. E308F]GEA19014.1 hypothetical protein E306M_21510 [Moorella sp. E306M]